MSSLPQSQRSARIAARYEVQSELGRGGMAVVYRVRDGARDRQVALKQLLVERSASHHDEAYARFEREFQVLRELSHPRIIQVYDYGLDAAGPFYTMELLEGGDLLERSPLPWRDACVLFHDVCSSLALLHSRRFVHCDITPRNVRCTVDGRAKLIDFGAMVPVGRSNLTVGTPGFVAPEMVARTELDAATDLFSLGATFYYALTGRPAFRARTFDALQEAWRIAPPPPSSVAPDTPALLDQLVLSLLSLDAAGRPRSAFEVMQRLAAIAGFEQDETLNPAAVYLASPRMVGRQPLLAELHEQLALALAGQGRALLVRGSAGSGRSRMLDALALACTLRGAYVLRAGAAPESDFAVAQALAEQLVEQLPETALATARREGVIELLFESAPAGGGLRLRDLTRAAPPRDRWQDALHRWLLSVAEDQPLALVVDDLERIDASSAGLLAQCAVRSHGLRLCLALTLQLEPDKPPPNELGVLARHARCFDLAPLTEPETTELVMSVFGDVPNVHVIGQGIHAVAAGNPALGLELARHLIDRGCVRYANGSWTLPGRLGPGDLPESADAALRARVATLRPHPRQLLEAQALASHQMWKREDYAVLSPGASAQQIDQAILELTSRGLVAANGGEYRLLHRSWVHVLTAHMSDLEKRERHASIAALYGESMKSVSHWFAAEQDERGLELLLRLFRVPDDVLDLISQLHISSWELGRVFQRALVAVERLQRRPRDRYDVLRWLVAFGVAANDAYYWQAAPLLLELLRRASGIEDYAALAHVTDPTARLTQALQAVFLRFENTPEPQRICPPQDAIRHLATFVATSIPVGARSGNLPMLESLPPLLEPLVPLSPAVAAIYETARATCELCVYGRIEDAHRRWLDTHQRLASQTGGELQFMTPIRDAIVAGIASLEVQLGLASAPEWAERIRASSLQAVLALELRKLIALQHGDWQAADELRKRAEYVALQSRAGRMFSNLLWIELETYALAADLTGIRDVKARIDLVSTESPLWRAARLLADATYKRVSGRLQAACVVYEHCLRACEPDPSDRTRPVQLWPIAIGLYVETLVDLGESERARSLGQRALERCEERGIAGSSHGVVRALALARAKLGELELAAQQLDARIRYQLERSVVGLVLGASYEARARVALEAGDTTCFEHFARLAAREYNCDKRSPLGARYERLLAEARQRFPRTHDVSSDLMSSAYIQTARRTSAQTLPKLFRDAVTPEQRAAVALSLLCEDRGASGGHLFLIGPVGIELAASQPGQPPSAELVAQAQHWFTEQVMTLDAPTMFESDAPASPSQEGSPLFSSIPLLCADERGLLHVGLAVLLFEGGRRDRDSDGQLAAALARELARADPSDAKG